MTDHYDALETRDPRPARPSCSPLSPTCCARLRLLVSRDSETDVMTLQAESAFPSEALRNEVTATLRAVTKLGGTVELTSRGSLPRIAAE
jgi:hypothetical protein